MSSRLLLLLLATAVPLLARAQAVPICDGFTPPTGDTVPLDGTCDGSDLSPAPAALCATACDDRRVRVYLPVDQTGATTTGEWTVRLYRVHGGHETAVLEETVAASPGGARQVLGPFTLDATAWGPGTLLARVDATDRVAECDEADQELDLGAWPYPASLYDADGDGYAHLDCGGVDCDDRDATIHPGATEVGDDGIDQDCDGTDRICDADGDGVLAPSCGGDDCNDLDASISPWADEIPTDGIDNNCSGTDACLGAQSVGRGCSTVPGPAGALALIPLALLVLRRRGAAATVAATLLATGCGVDNTLECQPIAVDRGDADGDGYPADDDCDDADASINPGAPETADTVDEDCDGLVDEGTPDTDQDGTPDSLDTEECDGLDNDGDGDVDEGYPDTDGDGVADCVDIEDCDGVDNDGDGQVDEGLIACGDEEICNGVDDDGDGQVDEGYPDTDGDGVADCVDIEDCDGVDNDGDGQVDEGFDLDGDGIARCCTPSPYFATYGAPTFESIEVYPSNGDGTFATPEVAVEGVDVRARAIGDFDTSDGQAYDLLWSEHGGSDQGLYLTRCDQEWQATKVSDDVVGGSVADVDEDGCLDLVSWDYRCGSCGDYGGGDGVVALGNCDGTFTTLTSVPAGSAYADWWDVRFLAGQWVGGRPANLGDWDGDGHVDLLVWSVATGGSGTSSAWLLRGDGTGNFSDEIPLPDIAEAGGGGSVVDMDGDGCVDWVVGPNDDGDEGAAQVIWGACAEQPSGQEQIADACESCYGDGQARAYDWNGDGAPDLLLTANQAQGGAGLVTWFENDGSGAMQPGVDVVPPWNLARASLVAPPPAAYSAACPPTPDTVSCTVDVDAATLDCGSTGAPVQLIDSDASLDFVVLEIDLADWSVLRLGGDVQDPEGVAVHVANSPSCDGWGGDSSEFENDSEAHLSGGTSLVVKASDRGSNATLLSASSVLGSSGTFQATVCDGYFGWSSDQGQWDAQDDHLFQIDGNEPDAEAGSNDTRVYVGIGGVVNGRSDRRGAGVIGTVTVELGRP